MEQAANRDFFFERPIVPRGELGKPAEEQFNEYTSRAAIFLGEAFDASPRRIDHALQGVFGPLAGDLLAVLGLGPRGIEREGELANVPVLGRVFTRGGTEGVRSRFIDELYEKLEETQKVHRSERQQEGPMERELRLQLTDAARAIQALSYVRRFTPTSSQRREMTDEINGIARDVLEFHERGRLVRGQFQSLRRRGEALEERARRKVQQDQE